MAARTADIQNTSKGTPAVLLKGVPIDTLRATKVKGIGFGRVWTWHTKGGVGLTLNSTVFTKLESAFPDIQLSEAAQAKKREFENRNRAPPPAARAPPPAPAPEHAFAPLARAQTFEEWRDSLTEGQVLWSGFQEFWVEPWWKYVSDPEDIPDLGIFRATPEVGDQVSLEPLDEHEEMELYKNLVHLQPHAPEPALPPLAYRPASPVYNPHRPEEEEDSIEKEFRLRRERSALEPYRPVSPVYLDEAFKRKREPDPEEPEPAKCAVCLESNLNCALDPCGHVFHLSCWEKCKASSPHHKCPKCRKPVKRTLHIFM